MLNKHKKAIESIGASLSVEMLDVFCILTPLQQDIAIGVILGMNHIKAYNRSQGVAKTDNTKLACVREMLIKPRVKEFLDLVKASRLNSAIMGRDEALERLTVIARGKLSDVINFSTVKVTDAKGKVRKKTAASLSDMDSLSDNNLSLIKELTAGKDEFKIKIHDSRKAMKQIGDMQGWCVATKHEITRLEQTPVNIIPEDIDAAEAGKLYEKMATDD